MSEEVWHRIFADWVKSFESINHLDKEGILDDVVKLKYNLLEDIIDTCRGEIEDEEGA